MNLSQFTADLRAMVDRFEQHWRARREVDPGTHWDHMSEEEWQEQFLVFMERNEAER